MTGVMQLHGCSTEGVKLHVPAQTRTNSSSACGSPVVGPHYHTITVVFRLSVSEGVAQSIIPQRIAASLALACEASGALMGYPCKDIDSMQLT